ncbi:MAG TPA: hypothetical protein VL200_08735 [Lacunisphaera sp.]|jgi:hypothetical protein|nr:hypothetical protein [Lacunisphaera sp.]
MKNLLTLLLLPAAALAADKLTVPVDSTPPAKMTAGVGVDFSRGDYGFASDTDFLSVPLNLSWERGAWSWNAAIPYVTLRGPATVVGGGGTPRASSASTSGLGDVLLGATDRFRTGADLLNVAFTGRVKLPTADDSRGLGTGRADGYGQFDFYETVGDYTPFASIGYRALGRSAAYPLKSGAYLGLGSHLRLAAGTVLTFGYDWGQRILDGGPSTSDATITLTTGLDAPWQFVVYGLKGFTDASPNFGGGLSLARRF